MHGSHGKLSHISDDWLDALGRCMAVLNVETFDDCEVGYIFDRWEAGASAYAVAAELWGPLEANDNGQ